MTSPFKRQVENDIKGVFLNEKEFSFEHDIDGVVYVCQIDSDEFGASPTDGPMRDVYASDKVLRIRLDELGYRPVTYQNMLIDGRIHTVDRCNEDQGMLSVYLSEPRA